MDERKLVHAPLVGPDPVRANPNRDREKTYQEPNPPREVTEENQKLAEVTAQDKVRDELPKAVDRIKERL